MLIRVHKLGYTTRVFLTNWHLILNNYINCDNYIFVLVLLLQQFQFEFSPYCIPHFLTSQVLRLRIPGCSELIFAMLFLSMRQLWIRCIGGFCTFHLISYIIWKCYWSFLWTVFILGGFCTSHLISHIIWKCNEGLTDFLLSIGDDLID